ncbi:MAG: YIP1 family protein [Prevotellaceae bacterium]|jgi:hypothetical protein|nr:YIP1 family protein [Prevotellaceae bacterium]
MKTIFLLILFVGIPGFLIWSIIKNAKATLSGLVGFFSLLAIIPMFPLFRILAHTKEMSLLPSALPISLVLIGCLIAYIVLVPFCVSSAIKNCKPNFEDYAKYTKYIFCVSIIVSAFTLITLLISSNIDAGFRMKMSTIMFSEWENISRGMSDGMLIFEVVSSILVLGFSIWGFFAKARKIKEVVKNQTTDTQDKSAIKIPNISTEDIIKGAEVAKQKTTELYSKTATSYQGAFNRAKQMLLSPKTEYQAIEQKDTPHTKVLTSYILPLLLIPALFAFIGYGLIGYSYNGHHFSDAGLGFRMAIVQIIVLLGGIYLSTFIINALADNFGATKNFNRTFSLVAYAYTPMFLAGIFNIHHSLWWLLFLVGLYGLYLLFVGLKPMLKPAEDKADTYSIISLAVTVVGYIVLFQILKAIMLPDFSFH